MAMLILVVCAALFLLGLVQWARSGAMLWDIRQFIQNRPAAAPGTVAEERREARAAKNLRDMENMVDGLLRSSFRILGVLALAVWLFVIASVVIDALGLPWLDSLSFQANRIWGDPFARSGSNARQNSRARNGTLRSLGSGLRR